MRELVAAFDAGKIPNSMTDPRYYNIKILQSKKLPPVAESPSERQSVADPGFPVVKTSVGKPAVAAPHFVHQPGHNAAQLGRSRQ